LEEFIGRGVAPFMLDELRVSTIARYADLQVEFGGQQTFNPFRFTPPAEAFRPDRDTGLLFHFEDDLKNAAGEGLPVLEGRWVVSDRSGSR
jgi:hypothetical protein